MHGIHTAIHVGNTHVYVCVRIVLGAYFGEFITNTHAGTVVNTSCEYNTCFIIHVHVHARAHMYMYVHMHMYMHVYMYMAKEVDAGA